MSLSLKNKVLQTLKMPKPIDAVVAITYKCNSRCTMCDIWKIDKHLDIDINQYKKLPKSLRFINISGGEPFLRPDIVEIVRVINKRCPKAYIIISSNGFAPNLVVSRVKQIREFMGDTFGIALSVDGMEKIHDKVRRIPNGFNKIMKTLDDLKAIDFNDIRLAFTVSDFNIEDLNNVYDLTKQKGVEFTMAYAQSSENYFGGIKNEFKVDPEAFKSEINKLVNKQLSGWQIKRWLRAFFTQGIYKFANHEKQPLPLVSGRKHFFLDPGGVIYPSVVHNMKMGNINNSSFSDIWYGNKAYEIREEIKRTNKHAWMICTARTAIIQHPLHVAKWIFTSKFLKKK